MIASARPQPATNKDTMTEATDQTELAIAPTDSLAATEIEEMDARKRLAALKLLKTRHDKILERQAARKGYWRNTLTELTQTLNEAIDAPEPVKDSQCRDNLMAIKRARVASEDAKAEKAAELKGLKDAIATIEKTMDELMLKGVGDQMSLELGAGQTAWLTKDVAHQVNVALSAREKAAATDGEEMAADLVALRADLENMGFGALVVTDEEDEPVEASDSDGDESEASDDSDEGVDDEPEGMDASDYEDGEVDYEEDPTDDVQADNVISLAGMG